MRRFWSWRALGMLLAAGVLIVGLFGAYSYGQAYSQHRGFGAIRRLPRARSGRLVKVHFYSRALHRRTDYLVYLPPGYTRAHRYPVYYLLHGSPGAPQAFISVAGLDVRLINRLSQNRLRPMLLVFADGRVHGDTFSDSEWANTPTGHFESYVVDVVHNVDQRFATIRSRQARVIGGYSAGAYGALNIALHQLPTFANVQSWSGYFTQTHDGVFAHASPATMVYNSPLAFAALPAVRRAIALHPLRAYMFIGRRDPAAPQIRPMVRELRRDGARASENVYPGGHDWQVWYSRVDPMMILASDWISHPLPPPSIRASRSAGAPTLPPPAAPTASLGPSTDSRQHVVGRRTTGNLALSVGLVLALASAALINLGFLLQHRGLTDAPDGPMLIAALRSRTWLAGQALGWVGFVTQIVAVALAPLSLVQAFSAGGLALSVPLAAGVFRHRITRRQLTAVVVMALSLAILPLGLRAPVVRSASDGMMLIAAILGVLVAAIAVRWRSPGAWAALAGVLYGVADVAIKADAVGFRIHGLAPLLSGWTLLALLGTFGGFLTFQAALRHGDAVSGISLMTAFAALTALVFGVLAFGESLGRSPVVSAIHLVAIGGVLACVPVLAAAQQDAVDGTSSELARAPFGARARGIATALVLSVVAVVALALALLSGTGLLYGLRSLGWFAAGPKVPNALPLLQLAGFDAQPLSRVLIAWVLAGGAFGLLLGRLRPSRRAGLAAVLGLGLLLFASDASLALARNDRLSDVLSTVVPGAGAWIEGALFALAAALPGARARFPRVVRRIVGTKPLVSGRAG